MKVCFYGNTGHFFTAFLARDRLPDVTYAAYCPSYDGESMGQLELSAGEAGCVLNRYNDLTAMLSAENPEILVVDNRFAQRYQAERLALERGIHVYADKPLAVTEAELAELFRCAVSNERLLWAMHSVRYDPWYYTANRLVRQGAVGKVRMVNCQKSYRLGTRHSFYGQRKYFGGTIPWVTIHAIDMITMITGTDCRSIHAAQSRAENRGYGDMEIITTSSLQMSGDILATISTDYYRPASAHSHDDDRMRVVGTDGIVEVRRNGGDHEVYLLSDGAGGFTRIPLERPPLLFEDFVNAVRGRPSGLLTMKDCVYNAYLAIAAQRSADEGKIIEPLASREFFQRAAAGGTQRP